MRNLIFTIVALSLTLTMALSGSAVAGSCDPASTTDDMQSLHQAQANPYLFQFESGATWELCWHIDKHTGLTISRVFYGAPGERPLQVFDAASLGQVLFKYDEDTDARHVLVENGFGGENYSSVNNDCEGGEVIAGFNSENICQRVRDLNHLTRARNHKSIRRHEVSLHARSHIGTHVFEQIWRFSEDGEISPALSFSGVINRFTSDDRYGVKLRADHSFASSATLLVNWRLDFNINGTSNNDLIHEIDFIPTVSDGAKRTIVVKPITAETSRSIKSEYFRGWRVSDSDYSSGENTGASATTRVGYYLDPQDSGFRFNSKAQAWSQFDFFVTKRRECEKVSSANSSISPGCAADLDSFVSGESVSGADSVVWFSVSRHFTPRREDYPVISAREFGFKLIPFDWSAYTPFSPPVETTADVAGQR